MNLVILHSHDTGRFVSPYGHAVPTPRLRAFAEEGVLFRRAFSAAPTCSPSRAAMLTGRYAHEVGMLGLAHMGHGLREPSQHLAATLRRAGYETALAGIQHEANLRHGHDPRDLGYDHFLNHDADLERTDGTDAAAAEFLKTRQPGGRPFFLFCGFFETHRGGPEGYVDTDIDAGPVPDARYLTPPQGLPNTPTTRRDTALYHQGAAALDQRIGRVLDALDDAGLREETVIVITTDHGIAFPTHKATLSDRGLGVMMMLRAPGLGGGRVVDGLASHVDLVPTLCELLGQPRPDWLAVDARSLMPLVRGESQAVRESVFGEVNHHVGYAPQRTVRTDRYAYVRQWHDRTPSGFPWEVDESLSQREFAEAGYPEALPVADEQLYDVLLDPAEARNLADDPAFADLLSDMRQRLAAWMKRTDDPLLEPID